MPCYKIEKLGVKRFLNFVDLASAQAYADTLGTGFTASLESATDFPPINISIKQKAIQDKYFLLGLVESFVEQNRIAGTTVAQDLDLLSNFNSIKQLAEVGAVPAVRDLIAALVVPIAGIYTEQRRELDLLKIDSYNDTL